MADTDLKLDIKKLIIDTLRLENVKAEDIGDRRGGGSGERGACRGRQMEAPGPPTPAAAETPLGS